MNAGPDRPAVPVIRRSAKPLWLEIFTVLSCGAVLALLANQLSPHGLKLTRDYFPKAAPIIAIATVATNEPASTIQVEEVPRAVVQRLRERGLQPIGHKDVVQRFHDPRYGSGVIFVDARDDTHFQAGHIPGAYQFNSYEMEKYFPTTLPACMAATNVVVYCTGGECEDSEFAAVTLNQAGVPLPNLFVYAGGISEWLTNSLPVETGDRNSGKLKATQP